MDGEVREGTWTVGCARAAGCCRRCTGVVGGIDEEKRGREDEKRGEERGMKE
jgi:hypothetical protein